jgi:hypothetical protein
VLNIIMLCVVMLGIVMLSIVMLSVVKLSVMAPFYSTIDKHTSLRITFSTREAKLCGLNFLCQ